MTILSLITTFAVSAIVASAEPGSIVADLRRAKQRIPRQEYLGKGSLLAANVRLNYHLSRHESISVQPCEEFSIGSLQAILRYLFVQASDELKAIYSLTDGRRSAYTSIDAMEAHWKNLLGLADERLRAGMCHEAVMWYVHHLTLPMQRQTRAHFVLPLLPVADHRLDGTNNTRLASDLVGQFYDSKVTCQDCHIGGPDPPTDSLAPKYPPKNAKQRSKRCDTNYKDMFGVNCGPCDGIDGIAAGDDDESFNQTECHVVAHPGEVDEDDRVAARFPEQFTVEIKGSSDHFGAPPDQPQDQPRLYALSSGMMYADIREGADMWLLRHDSFFTKMFANGETKILSNASMTQVHAQSRWQRWTGNNGPQVQLSQGMGDIASDGCTCAIDVVGVPSTQRMKNLEYMGRIRLPELEFVGGEVVYDHWANWFFHIFMDTNKSVPHYGKAPSRISDSTGGGPKTGFSVYGHWKLEDPEITDPLIWQRGLPTTTTNTCRNVDKSPECEDISQSTFPPRRSHSNIFTV